MLEQVYTNDWHRNIWNNENTFKGSLWTHVKTDISLATCGDRFPIWRLLVEKRFVQTVIRIHVENAYCCSVDEIANCRHHVSDVQRAAISAAMVAVITCLRESVAEISNVIVCCLSFFDRINHSAGGAVSLQNPVSRCCEFVYGIRTRTTYSCWGNFNK